LRIKKRGQPALIWFSELLTILRAELVGAVDALKGCVGLLKKAFRIEENAQFPDQEDGNGQSKKTPGVEAFYKEQRREHHQMIPVEDAACGAAAVLHQQTKRTPDQHTDEITHIEDNRNEEQMNIGQDA